MVVSGAISTREHGQAWRGEVKSGQAAHAKPLIRKRTRKGAAPQCAHDAQETRHYRWNKDTTPRTTKETSIWTKETAHVTKEMAREQKQWFAGGNAKSMSRCFQAQRVLCEIMFCYEFWRGRHRTSPTIVRLHSIRYT